MRYDEEIYIRQWEHRPAHLYLPESKYIVTGSTCNKYHFFDNPKKKTILQDTLFEQCDRFSWRLEAWAIFGNHYHFIAESPGNPETLVNLVKALHSKSAMLANRLDNKPGRKIWYQYWDTCITNEKSYFARLKYVHENPQKHLLVEEAANYPWCSMRYLLQEKEYIVHKILGMNTDRLSIQDEF